MPRPLSDCQELIVATSNLHKVRELSSLLIPLRIPVLALPSEISFTPIVEDGTTLAENARKKAIGYASQLQRWVLADDTGLEVAALGGAPGVHSARYAGENATAEMNLAHLIQQMQDLSDEQRTARFVCHLCLVDPEGNVALETQGICPGRILFEPIGHAGFGYDSLFQVAGMKQSLAQLSEDQTAVVGHRGHAARALLDVWHQA
ncbi:RdgB/HAM1 family non-canonical purine NTP pyrophosphatase [Blastopirellula marina]|uniref:dITP/XTP pyrophosphatase n=1 Tax=Blastopirellula marina TaxID=124 RepID=A0A2S8FN35_9BACT|nr:RdgB/HAM1 family non-canonical purine NTP pyrophosphatase [Blastopirellula marina]PQO33601.1 non-canonical purine NTP pyrophosphatase, RdgB/HAM1 family [Blastopirellula marina]PTL43388.1 non-canonical purine NTP pyrophosphatase, RdgB/HAM1 family [Blastopirellula marina]